jgi:hypothetical protein
VSPECTIECERMPECLVCRRRKNPRGRSAPMGMYLCHPHDCPGYDQEPTPGHLWPGELAREAEYEVEPRGNREGGATCLTVSPTHA